MVSHQQLTVPHHLKVQLMILALGYPPLVTQLSVVLTLICHLMLEHITNLLPTLLVPACKLHL